MPWRSYHRHGGRSNIMVSTRMNEEDMMNSWELVAVMYVDVDDDVDDDDGFCESVT